jgi:transposase
VVSLIEAAKLNDIDLLAYLSDILTRLVQGHPINRIAELLPWAYKPAAIGAGVRTNER